MKTIAQKIGVKNNYRTIFVDAPIGIVELFELPSIENVNKLMGEFDYIHFFVKDKSKLEEKFPLLKQYIKLSGMLWISWPKSGQLGTDLNLKKIINIGYSFGLVESTTISVNQVWSAIKFTYPKKDKIYQNSYGILNLNSIDEW